MPSVSWPAHEDQFQAVLDQSIAGVYVLSEDGLVRYVNNGFARLSGRTPGDVIGHQFLEFVDEPDHESLLLTFRAALEQQQGPFEVHLRTAVGDRQTVLTQGGPTRVDGQRAVVGVAIDVTGRRQVELALTRANGFLRVIRAANQTLVRSSTEAELMERTCAALVDAGGYQVASIALCRAGGGLQMAAFGGADVRLGDMETLGIDEGAPGGHESAIRLGEKLLCRDPSDDRLGPMCAGLAAAALYLPLKKNAEAFGSLGIYSSDAESFQADELATLEELTDDLAYGISALRGQAEREASSVRLQRSLEETIAVLAAAAEMRDPYTAGHQQQVAALAVAIARELGLDESRARVVRFAALVHDVGKIRIPAELLTRTGDLSELERQLVQTHVQAGYEILRTVEFPWPIAEFVLQHHEHLDGTGYPNGAKGDALYLESRILAVADVVEAMSADRPYRRGKGIRTALDEVVAGRGSRYDADVVDACVRLFTTRRFAFAPYKR
jgi:PAS domain S-box-containing protein/putative nucleotidyltransferase with HDIG domain